ncbi:MAG: DUF4493 domain-containing protein, partial [Bacteroidaceae bacterium]|nr:DUF4493 domain-containing protein [Bacteroidaceae bacterium]
MKKIYAILVAFVAVLFTACTNKEDFAQEEMGYLTLEISAPKGTRAIPADYNPKQLYVEVVDKNGTIVLSTDDASKWAGETLKLRAGTYTVNAHSNNWDGGDAGKDAPFYAGTTTVTVIQGQKSEAELTCTLANVKVSVEFDETVAAAFKKVSVDVFSALSGVETMHFEMGGTLTPAYFPVGRLTARLTVVNKADETYTMDTPISDVKARDHFIFKYSTKAVGQTGAFTVTADDAQNIFTYNFYVPVHASTQLKLSPVNAWGRFAYAQGSISLEKGAAEASKATIQYQKKGDSEWQSVAVTMTGEDVKATLTGLTPATDYACKVAYADEDGTIYSNVQEFTTEAEAQMPNSNMDDWYKGKFDTYECVYPCSQSYWEQQGGSFWGTSNAGTALLNKAITNEEKTDVHTEGG